MAVDKAYRKHRFGYLLVAKLHQWVQADAKAANRPAEVECHSHVFTTGFYAKLGYMPEGDQYNEPCGPGGNMILQKMVVRLPLNSE